MVTFNSWSEIPKNRLIELVNEVFDPFIHERASFKDSRQVMIDALIGHGVNLIDVNLFFRNVKSRKRNINRLI